MARDPEKRLEDWMRLILLNWVLISFIMFYSILMGLAGGCIVVLFSAAVIDHFGLPTRFLHLYPSPAPASILVMGGLIASFFLHLFKHLHYNCTTGSYTLEVARVVNIRAAAGFLVVALILVGVGAGIAWLFPS